MPVRVEHHRANARMLVVAAAAVLCAIGFLRPEASVATAQDTDVTYTVSQLPAAGSVLQVGSALQFTVDVTAAPGSFAGPVTYDLKKPANMTFQGFGSQPGNLVTSCSDSTPSPGYLRCTLGSGGIPAGALSTGGPEIVLTFAVSSAAAGASYSGATIQGLFSDSGSGFRNAGDTADSTAASGSNDDTLDASVGALTVAGPANVSVSAAAAPPAVFEGGLTTVTVTFTHALGSVGPLLQPLDAAVSNGDVQVGSVACPGGTGTPSIVGNTARCSGSTISSGDTMTLQVRARDTAAGDDVVVAITASSMGMNGSPFTVPVAEVGLQTMALPAPGPAIPPWTTGSTINVCTAAVGADAASDAAAGGAQDAALVAGTSSLTPLTPMQAGDFAVNGPGGTVVFTYLSQSGAQCGAGQSGVQFTASTSGSYAVSAYYNGDTSSLSTQAATRGSNTLTLAVADSNPAPSISSLSPSTLGATGMGFTLTVNGSGFVPGSTVRWNGTDRATAYVNSSQLTATINGADMAAAGSASLTVFNPPPGGGTSSPATFTITGAPSGAPSISSLAPAAANAGTTGFTLTVYGSSFVPGAIVRWNGADRTTTFISSGQLTAAIAAGDLAAPGSASVTVYNPPPGGGTSLPATFTISAAPNPAPTLSSAAPSTIAAGSGTTTLTLNGSGFVAGSVVRWNGADRATLYVSTAQLTATILAADVQTAGTASVTVFSPAPGGGTSSPVTVNVNNPTPSVGSLSPPSATVGTAGLSLTVNGTGFVPGSSVRWNGVDLVTSYVNSTTLSATVPADNLAAAAVIPVTVFSPAPGGGGSGTVSFSVNNPVPAISALGPSSGAAAGPAFTLAVDGTNFVPGATVRWNGSDRTTTFVSSTHLTAGILPTDIAAEGSATVTVFNPGPGGGTSGGQPFTIGDPEVTASDQLVVSAPAPDTMIARSRLAFSVTSGDLDATEVWFVVKRSSDGKYWNGAAHAWQDDEFENAATEEDGTWVYAVTGEDRRQFVDTQVVVEARATVGGLPYASALTPTMDIR